MKLRVQVGASGTNVNMLQAMEQAAIAGDVATGHDRDMDHSIYFGSVLRPVVSIPPSLLAVTEWLPHSLTLPPTQSPTHTPTYPLILSPTH